MKKLLLIMTIISPMLCHADSLYFGLFTDHFVPGSFNETNSVMMAQLDSGLTFGSMTNSYNEPSILIGYVQPNKPIALGLVFATGYEPENFYLEDHLDSLPVVPLPVVSLNINITDSVAITSNVIAGIVFNSGVTYSF